METEEPSTKVNLSTRRSFAASFGSHLKETFFPDDPFRQFKDLPPCGKAWAALKYFVPMLVWASSYTFAKFRLGILVDFLSRSTITGFMGGTAIIIILQQLKGMLGLKHFTTKTDVVSVMHSVFKYRDEVGSLRKGLNPISISDLKFQSRYLSTTMKAGLLSGFLALAEGIAVGRSLALLKNEQIDGNKEMIAFGMMNIVGSFFSCYLTTAIIMVAMIGLIEYEEIHHLFKVDKFDFCICMAAFLGVVLFNMVAGLASSVGLSILRALLYVARPNTCKLGNLTGTAVYRDIEQYPSSSSLPDILILQLGSPIYFANAGYLRERILRWVEDEESIIKKDGEDLLYVILDIGGVTSIDNTGIGMLKEIYRILGRRKIKMVITNPRLEVAAKLVSSNFINLIGENWVFLSVRDAITACRYALQESREKGEQA
ncbi:putative Sulfate transporter 3.1 [Cocos nucifera]|uniref:Putative Sulfate transporter 3.1 n=1 Tax=Cocos nucifera TaxID=13894 RepID=A0A8K0I9U0_COCNU|nr:putative Sulfate transporter 3.1 [Cocos nucifera]